MIWGGDRRATRAGRHASAGCCGCATSSTTTASGCPPTTTSARCCSPSSTTPAIRTPTRASPRATAPCWRRPTRCARGRSNSSRSSTSAPSRSTDARRLADGRSSFVARVVGGPDRLVCFERTREYESSAVHLAVATRRARGAAPRPGLGAPVHAGRCRRRGTASTGRPSRCRRRSSSASRRTCRTPTRRAGQPAGAVHALAGGRARRGDARVADSTATPTSWTSLGLQAVGADPAARPAPARPLRRPAQRARRSTTAPRSSIPAGRSARSACTCGRPSAAAARSRPTAARATRRPCASAPTAPSAIVFVVSSNGTLSVFRRGERLLPA